MEVIPLVVGFLCVISTVPKRLKIGVSVKSGHLQKTFDLVLLVYYEQHSNHAERLPAQSTGGEKIVTCLHFQKKLTCLQIK